MATGCRPEPATPQPLVLVEVAPMVSLVRPLLAPGIEIRTIVPPGVSPHGYQLTPGDARAMAQASLVITVGPVLEPAINRAVQRQTPPDRLVTMAALLGIETSDDPHHHGHNHGHDHGHDHDHDHTDTCEHTTDPHLWLDPELVIDFVNALPGVLEPRGLAAADATATATALAAEAAAIRDEYRDRLAPFAGRAIITHHDAFRRIADRYGIVIAQVIRPVAGSEPTPGDLTRVLEAAQTHAVGAIFVEPQYPDAMPRRIADRLGLSIRVLNPEGGGDWAVMMRSNLDELVAGLSTPAPAAGSQPGGG
jgi:zinc transport system substrate-binding protein